MQFHPHTVQTHTPTALGTVWLAASPQGLCGAWFDGQRHFPAPLQHPSAWPAAPDDPVLRRAAAQLQRCLQGARAPLEESLDVPPDVPLDIAGGSPFEQAVWRALQGIARGHTCSYGALASRLGQPQAVRAVASAVGRNPLSVFIPCHRVLGAQGQLAGYAGGLQRKAALLRLEGAVFKDAA